MCARIVSLVPSLTELLFHLGLGDQVVGRTGFCVHPADGVRAVPKVGGTKDLLMDRIRALEPTHVILNVDENRREDAETLAAFVPEVVVTHPLGPLDNPGLYRRMGALFGAEPEAERLCAAFAAAHLRLRETGAARSRQDVLYLIWREPWMTVSEDTYIARTLELVGWHNHVLGGSDERYPTVALEDYAGAVGRVLLSSEPFHFKDHHRAEVAARVPGAAVSLIDGEMTSWYGSRAIAAMDYLAELAAAVGTSR